jgi:hypothetical protein
MDKRVQTEMNVSGETHVECQTSVTDGRSQRSRVGLAPDRPARMATAWGLGRWRCRARPPALGIYVRPLHRVCENGETPLVERAEACGATTLLAERAWGGGFNWAILFKFNII